ncbi:MAG: hypothetical protein MZU97_14635 [Bacillus subtilis]|nr:hypothetical protein [Bacillus subtilis]
MRTHDACYEKLMADVAEHYRKLDSSTEHLGKGYVWAIAGLFLGAFVNFLINVYSVLHDLLFVRARPGGRTGVLSAGAGAAPPGDSHVMGTLVGHRGRGGRRPRLLGLRRFMGPYAVRLPA